MYVIESGWEITEAQADDHGTLIIVAPGDGPMMVEQLREQNAILREYGQPENVVILVELGNPR